MSLFNFFYHLFIYLIGVLLSIPFTLLLIYIFTSNISNDHIHQVTTLLFPTKQTKSDILTIPSNEIPFHSVWMFGVIAAHIKPYSRVKLQPIYLKLYHQYLFIHLTSKGLKNFNRLNRNKIVFSEVIIFDLSQAKIELKPYEQFPSQYWSNKTPIVLSQLQLLARYHIDKKKKNQQQEEDKKTSDYLRQLIFQWFTNKDEIHLYTLTMRSKEEWFYRLHNSIKLYSKSINEQPSNDYTESKTKKSFLSSWKRRNIPQRSLNTNSYNSNIPLDQIEIEYNQKTSLLYTEKNKTPNPTDNSLKHIIKTKDNQTWRILLSSFFERIYNSSLHISSMNNKDQSEKLNHDYLCLINIIISRCTINVYENLNIRNYFKEKIQHELKHIKLPYYIQWIRMSNFHCDNIYPKIENFKKTWFNQNGLWIAVDFTYQGNISIEFTIKINLIRKKNKISMVNQKNNNLFNEYSFIPTTFKRLFYFRDNIQVLRKMINTILTITINIRSINGVLLINIPLPPSDRIWFGFEEMPLIDFDVHHRQISPNKSRSSSSSSTLSFISAQSSINSKNYSNKELNQIQTTINNFLSRWIKKQIHKECVLPNMHDICLKWCNNPFEINIKENLLTLSTYRVNHLLWFNENDLNKFDKNIISCPNKSFVEKANKNIYFIAQWKQKNLYQRRKQKLLLIPKKVLLTDTFLIFKHHYRLFI